MSSMMLSANETLHTIQPTQQWILRKLRHITLQRPITTGAQQPTAPLRTTGCAGQTHSPAASSDLTPLRTIGYAGRTHSSAALPDLCATPDNQLPRTEPLACSSTGPFCTSSPTDYPGTQSPVASRQCLIAPDHSARHCTGSARHRQFTRPALQCSGTPIVSSHPSASPKPSSPQGSNVGTPHKSTSSPFQGPTQHLRKAISGPFRPLIKTLTNHRSVYSDQWQNRLTD